MGFEISSFRYAGDTWDRRGHLGDVSPGLQGDGRGHNPMGVSRCPLTPLSVRKYAQEGRGRRSCKQRRKHSVGVIATAAGIARSRTPEGTFT